jgi:GGDEF domain-containing protein
MRPAIDAAAAWVIQSGDELITAAFSVDETMPFAVRRCGLAFPLACRGRRVGALVGLDVMPSVKPPRLVPPLLAGVRRLLEPAAVALDNALLLKRAEALSVTDELTGLYNARYLNQALRREEKRASRSVGRSPLLFIRSGRFQEQQRYPRQLFGSRALVDPAPSFPRLRAVNRHHGRGSAARVCRRPCRKPAPPERWRSARAIRERIAAHRFLVAEGLDCPPQPSRSAQRALPEAAVTAEALLHARTRPLYQVKDAGKNGIRVAG